MKKRMISMAMTAVMALTLVVAAAPVQVHAEVTQPDTVTVSYTHERQAGGTGYVVTIPSSVTFTSSRKTADLSVAIKKLNGDGSTGVYEDASKSVTVKIKSTNGYKLTNNDTATVGYTVTYEGATTSSFTGTTEQEIGKLGTTKLAFTGTAELSDTSALTVTGEYTDTLTFSLTENTL